MFRHFSKCLLFIQAVLVLSILLLFIPFTSGPVRASAAGFTASWPYKADVMHSSQVVVVEAKSFQSRTGLLSLQEKVNGQWKSVLSGIPVSLRTNNQDYWVDDPLSPEYNQWVSYAGDPDTRWQSCERLLQPLYRYAIVLRYNDAPVVSGKGSAIFLHIWSRPGMPTAGCIAMQESHLLRLMRLLDPARSPAIAIGISG